MIRRIRVQAGSYVLLITITRMQAGSNPEREVLSQRAANSRIYSLLCYVIDLSHQLHIPLLSGFLVNIVNGSCDGISPVQRTLWAASDLYAFKVESAPRRGAVDTNSVSAIDISRDRSVTLADSSISSSDAAQRRSVADLVNRFSKLQTRNQNL